MSSVVYISELEVRKLLNFENVYEVIKVSLESVSRKRAIQHGRSIMYLPHTKNKMYTMPGYLQTDKCDTLGCKIITEFSNNVHHGLPSLIANVLLMDEKQGGLKAVVAATEITLWRTAAASAVATKFLHGNKDKKVLAIIGAGAQAKIHAQAFQHYFSFKEVKIWNRTTEKAQKLAKELGQGNEHRFVAYEDIKQCVEDADVIVTATASDRPLVQYEWIKKGIHINVVGVNGNNFELDEAIYKASDVYVDSWDGAKSELTALNVEFKGQVGDVVVGLLPTPSKDATTVFQSLGMAVEDCAVARLIYDQYNKTQ